MRNSIHETSEKLIRNRKWWGNSAYSKGGLYDLSGAPGEDGMIEDRIGASVEPLHGGDDGKRGGGLFLDSLDHAVFTSDLNLGFKGEKRIS